MFCVIAIITIMLKRSGGVCMYVREDTKCSSLSLHPNSLSENIEVLWSECLMVGLFTILLHVIIPQGSLLQLYT